MRYLQQILLTILLITVPALSQTASESTLPSPDEASEIRRLLTEIEQAFVTRDPAPIERIYLEGYVGIRGRPIYNALDQLVAMVRWDAAAIRSGKKLDFETLSFDNENPTVTIFGDVAVVTTVKKNLWRYKESRCLNRYQSTDVFAKVSGRWRLALGHMSSIPCDPMPWQPPHPAVVDIRNKTRPSMHLSPSTETEIRELISKLTETGLNGTSGNDAFAADFISTTLNNQVSADRVHLLAALRIPTSRNGERYRDDEAFLNFGGNAAAYIFRVRSFAKGPDSKPEPPVTVSVVFSKMDGAWRIVASHESTLLD